jgi:ABC-type branched-subunit amino acid transport system ATPase component
VSAPTKAVLAVGDLGKAFGRAQVLDGVSFAIAEGKSIGLIGPNGVGKTTLFNLIAGNDAPDRGDIRLHGRSIDGLDIAARARSRHRRAARDAGARPCRPRACAARRHDRRDPS